jgi:hypothetical protein
MRGGRGFAGQDAPNADGHPVAVSAIALPPACCAPDVTGAFFDTTPTPPGGHGHRTATVERGTEARGKADAGTAADALAGVVDKAERRRILMRASRARYKVKVKNNVSYQ